MGQNDKILSSAEQTAIRQDFRAKEGFDPESTAALRRTADSLVANVSAMQHAIQRIEVLEAKLAVTTELYKRVRRRMEASGMQSEVLLFDQALEL